MLSPADTLSLAGAWQLTAGSIRAEVPLPGTLDTAGLGAPEPPQAGRLTRRHTYAGPARWVRTVALPPAAGGRLFWEVERARQLSAEVDGAPLPALIPASLSTAAVFELTPWAGRTVALTLISDNTYPGWPAGAITYASAATDETQTNWNGILGALRVVRRPAACILAVRVYPGRDTLDVAVDVAAAPTALARAFVELASPALAAPARRLPDALVPCPAAAPGAVTTLWLRGLAVRPGAPRWDEFDPQLTTLSAALFLPGSPAPADEAETRFGLRDFRVQGGRLALNGRAIFLRGEANCCVFPRTGHPPMDKAAWAALLGRYAAYGVNCVRFHSWCPPEAAFAAADEAGMLLQPELSDWDFRHALEDPAAEAYYARELCQILWTYANHPSFVMLSLGNELGNGEAGRAAMHRLLGAARRADPTRLYASASNDSYGEKGPDTASDFFTAMANRGAMLRATSSPLIGHLNHEFPGTRRHYTQAAEAGRGGQAVFGFEVGQYEIWPDFAQLARYDGVTLPHNLAMIRRRAAQTGAGACWTAGVAASGELALLCYKEEVEAALRTPAMSGLSLLGLQDFPGQGTALVGMMDALAEPKPYAFAAPARFKAFFAPVLPLARFDRYTFAAGDVFAADLELANYGRAAVGALHWLLYDDTAGCPLDGGELAGPFAPGGLRGAGAIACRLPDDGRAHRLTLRLRAGSAANAYPLWCYPDAPAEPAPAGVRVLTRLSEQDLGWIAAGGRALLDPDAALPGSLPCAFSTDFWSVGTFPAQTGTMGLLIDPAHPALADFPTEFHANWQWWAPAQGRALPLPAGVRPIVRVLDSVTRLGSRALLWEAQVGRGRVLLSGMALHRFPDRPECAHLLHCLTRYLAAPARPAAPLAPEALRRLVAEV